MAQPFLAREAHGGADQKSAPAHEVSMESAKAPIIAPCLKQTPALPPDLCEPRLFRLGKLLRRYLPKPKSPKHLAAFGKNQHHQRTRNSRHPLILTRQPAITSCDFSYNGIMGKECNRNLPLSIRVPPPCGLRNLPGLRG